MRKILTALAFMAIAIPQAQAADNRISVNEIHALIQDFNTDLNTPNTAVGRNFLNQLIADNAAFDNHLNIYSPNYAAHQVWYGHAANPYYYRYPYATAPYRSQVSTKSLTKWEHIGQYENKRRLIPGYQSKLSITNINMRPYARTAVIDVDMKEFSLGYNPYSYNATGTVLHANSKCKLYIEKQSHDLNLTRMNCNTNTSLPL